MALLVLAYPELSDGDFNMIQEFRKEHDELNYELVGPHFTLVFPVRTRSGWETNDFMAEVEKQIDGIEPFEFCIRCATLNKDAFNDYYHVFLVPDEGHSHTVKLHDRLYAEKLFPERALFVDFVPHIGIGNAQDPKRCLEMIELWNTTEFSIAGRVSALDVVTYENNTVETVVRLPLGV